VKESPIRSDPLTQILLQTTALLTYAPTRSNGEDPLNASAVAVHR
jgi:hypothetical protein